MTVCTHERLRVFPYPRFAGVFLFTTLAFEEFSLCASTHDWRWFRWF